MEGLFDHLNQLHSFSWRRTRQSLSKSTSSVHQNTFWLCQPLLERSR